MSQKTTLVLFDFDGTVTKKDSLFDFIQYAFGTPKFYLGLLFLSPVLVFFKLKLIPNQLAKERLITYFFKGLDSDHFTELADAYAHNQIDRIIRPKAVAKIKWHQKHGHKVVIVTASIDCWVKGWCDKNGIDLIATRLEVCEGKLTGKFATNNCYGPEKVHRVKDAYDLGSYDYIYAYGDSRGDKELMALADESFYKLFRK